MILVCLLTENITKQIEQYLAYNNFLLENTLSVINFNLFLLNVTFVSITFDTHSNVTGKNLVFLSDTLSCLNENL